MSKQSKFEWSLQSLLWLMTVIAIIAYSIGMFQVRREAAQQTEGFYRLQRTLGNANAWINVKKYSDDGVIDDYEIERTDERLRAYVWQIFLDKDHIDESTLNVSQTHVRDILRFLGWSTSDYENYLQRNFADPLDLRFLKPDGTVKSEVSEFLRSCIREPESSHRN